MVHYSGNDGISPVSYEREGGRAVLDGMMRRLFFSLYYLLSHLWDGIDKIFNINCELKYNRYYTRRER